MTHDEEPRAMSQPDAIDATDESEHSVWRMSRRRFLATSATTGAVLGMETLATVAHAQEATPAAATPVGMESMPGMGAAGNVDPLSKGLVYFSPPDAAVILAAAERLIPKDDNGPGATDAGVLYFIDRQMAHETRGYTGPIYNQGPFMAGTPTQGDQSGLSTPDRFRLGIAGMDAYAQQLYQSGFASLTGEQQDRILTDMEKGTPDAFGDPSSTTFPPTNLGEAGTKSPSAVGASAFFSLLLEYVKAGFFADPIHGGNRDMVGWKLIGFPGAQMGYADLIEDYGKPFTGEFKSLADYQTELDGGL
ncbi:MAG TPA: gluconate 2-dehydrogenase subunit 3 family protein [Thermomicrobiales bacterium]|nr:gluconate 2-dehydrogenase subunit 3 family protein [Thermomicrobiales bacterium]